MRFCFVKEDERVGNPCVALVTRGTHSGDGVRSGGRGAEGV